MNDKEILNFFMDDGVLLKKRKIKKEEIIKENIVEKNIIKENIVEEPPQTSVVDTNVVQKVDKEGFGEVDYAILKSITYGFKTIKEIAKALQIRTIIVERHIYKLIKERLIKYFQHAVLTSKGKHAMKDFENNNPEDVWKPIDEYIISVIKHNKERSLKIQKAIDTGLLISMIILIILIIYFGIF